MVWAIGRLTPLAFPVSQVTTAETGEDIVMDLGYVVPPMGSNCSGSNPSITTDFFTGAQDSSIPMDVAEGYSLLLDEFVDVYGDPGDADDTGAAGALAMARTAQAMADANATDAELKALQDAVNDALAEYNKQKAEFDALASGPVNQAGVAEWMAKSAVTNAVADYNTAVGMANAAKTTLDAMDYVSVVVNDDDTITTTSKYVPLTGTELITDVVTIANGMGTAGTTAMLRNYANADGDQYATVDSMTGQVTYTNTSNFDSNGNLVVPMEVDSADRDGDGATDDYVPTLETTSFSVADVRTRVENYNIAAATLKKLRDENQHELLQLLYDEAYDRAQAEADYYNAIWAEVTSDSTDQRTQNERDEDHADYEEDAYSISSRNAAYVKASNTRASAEADLRAKAAAREMATEAVVSAFQTPSTFYDQLVARRQAKKFAADKAVADATNPGKSLTDAQDAADKALMEAEQAQMDFQALYGDASDPVQDLIDELLKTDGDDGDALVNALNGSFDTANAAKETADQVAEDVAGLTGEGGAVAANTAAIEANDADIENLDGRVTQNETDIAANTTMIGENRSMITTNATNIAANTTMIGENRGMIETNMADIVTNAGNIMTNSGRIDANEAAIGMNTSAIADNAAAIGSNRSSIMQNAGMIGDLQDQMEVVRAGVAASMALAGMPAINGRGISIGVGSYDGESAFAVGFQIQGEMASFKIGVTSAGGETGASAGVGFQF